MNKIRLVIGTTLVAGAVVPPVVSYLKFRKEELARRLEITRNAEKNIEAIKQASLAMEQRMRDGSYRPKGVQQVFDDLEFEIITRYNQ